VDAEERMQDPLMDLMVSQLLNAMDEAMDEVTEGKVRKISTRRR
jgi:hypothetical protein